ncbi:MAG TPA: hypothetical protein EYG79_05885 [Rhodobacteraceae bacterium]|nr:hypothetical protein [Paracoccaceae bacterium]
MRLGGSFSARISGVVAGIAGDFVANIVSAELAEAKKGRDGSFTALGVFGDQEPLIVAGAQQRTENGCLVVYRGVTGSPSDDATISSDGLSSTALAALNLADQPAFYLELDVSKNENARQLTVRHLQYAATSARFNGTGQKNVVVAIGFAVSAKKPEDAQSASEVYRLNLGRLEIGHTYGAELAATSASRVTSSEPPFNIVVEVHETDQPDVALAALAKAFESNKADVADAVTDAISGQ